MASSVPFSIVFLGLGSLLALVAGADFLTLENRFANPAASALVHLSFGLFMLAILTPREKAGLPGLALGVGAFGWTACLWGWGNLDRLSTALAVNSRGPEAVFGKGVHSAPDMFALGLPSGVAAVAQLVTMLLLLTIAWNGWRLRRWQWVAVAYALALGSAALGAVIETFAVPPANPLAPAQEFSWISVAQAYRCAIGLIAVLVLWRTWPLFVSLVTAESRETPEAPPSPSDDEGGGLLATWKAQSRRG